MRRLYASFAAVPLLAATLVACGAAGNAGVVASRCGQLSTFRQTLGIPTPLLASPTASAAAIVENSVGISVWSDCIQPQTVTVRPGQLVVWGASEEGVAAEIVLEDGTSLGHIRHVLEFRFALPGTYRYHLRHAPAVGGTIVVEPQ